MSSQSPDTSRHVDPIGFQGAPAVAGERLVKVVGAMRGAQVVSNAFPYVRARYTTRWWRFVDDVEFYVDDAARVIHVRSASRVGYADFGVNRRRVERIRQAFAAAAETAAGERE